MTRKEALEILKYNREMCDFNPMTGDLEPMNEDCRNLRDAIDWVFDYIHHIERCANDIVNYEENKI